MRYLAEHAYPVPTVHAASGPDLVLQRIHGPTLAQALTSGTLPIEEGARLLADLHRALHALPPRCGARHGVLHLDLHPENVLLAASGPVVLDWRNAAEGPPELDVAVTALILAEVAADPEGALAEPASALLRAFARLTDQDPASALPDAVALRRRDPALSAAEVARLEDAARLVAGVPASVDPADRAV
jgi:aminoglycoside phosphotransferase (APT) family kinase protein